MHLKENTTLQGGRYRIIRKLGSGGFGITYLAEDTRFGETVAIKEFFMRQYCNRDNDTLHVSVGVSAMKETVKYFYDKFFREAQKTRKLKHRNIVKITDLFPENGTAYYVMDYHPGGSLGSLVRRQGALNEAQALRYIRQVASALEHIHKNNMAHLDIKPDNILLDDEDNAIVIDFGISKHYDDEGNATTIIPGANAPYTPGYAADSQVDVDKVCLFSPTLDIYSLGATLYNLVTGEDPPISAVIINYGFPTLPDRISSSTCIAIKKAMEPISANRPQSVDEFLALLDTPAGGSRVTEPMGEKQLKCDILFDEAARMVVERQLGSQSLLQRVLSIGYNRAARIMEQLCEAGIVGEYNGGKPRQVLCHSIVELESLLKNFILIREELPPPPPPSPKKPFNRKLPVAIAVAILCIVIAGVGINECNDNRAEQHYNDSVVAVKRYNDSIVTAIKHYNDSIKDVRQKHLAALEKARQDSIATAERAAQIAADEKRRNDSIANLPGKLYVTTTPVGAVVAVDGKRIGTTPINAYELKKGSYTVKITKDGYTGYSTNVAIYSNEPANINTTLSIDVDQCYKKGVTAYNNKNYTEAVKWYRKAAEQGHADAQYNLALCYLHGNGVSQNDTENVKWYRKAAEQGHVEAQKSLGWCYYKGRGIRQNYTEAVKWYRKAAEQGNAGAQNYLGDCYHNGEGVTKNYAEAVKWYRKAAEQGSSGGQLRLGYCYENGKGVTKDLNESVIWYRKAAEQGSSNAAEALLRLRLEASVVEKQQPQNNVKKSFNSKNVTFTVKGINFTMVAVAGGTFNMGSNDGDSDEKPVHSVTLSDYYIGETEVTQELWQAVMGSNPSYFKGNKNPVEQVSYKDCEKFIDRLNDLLAGHLPDGRKFRLPSEAQWEFAARGGNKGKNNNHKFSGNDSIDAVAWYGYDKGNSNIQTHPVKQKQPNELGLYDMSGNVWEWCSDWYDSNYYSSSPLTNPEGPQVNKTYRVLRGGGWNNSAPRCRVAYRSSITPDNRIISSGLRLAF